MLVLRGLAAWTQLTLFGGIGVYRWSHPKGYVSLRDASAKASALF
jgi:hypothetical protein